MVWILSFVFSARPAIASRGVVAAVAAMVTTLTLTPLQGPGWAEEVGQSQATPPTSQKTLTMGTAADYPPFQFKVDNSDEIQGFEIDLANYIAAKLGFAIKLEDMDFEALLPALQARQLDFAMAAITPTPEREQRVAFSQAYFTAQEVIVTPKGTRLVAPGEFAGKTIGVQAGTLQAAKLASLAKTLADLQVNAFQTVTAMMQALTAGEVDAAVLEESVAKLYVADHPTLQMTPMHGAEKEPIAIAFPLDSDYVAAFNRVLTEMAASGELDRLIKKWFEQP